MLDKVDQAQQGEQAACSEVRPRVVVLEADLSPVEEFHLLVSLTLLLLVEDLAEEITEDGFVLRLRLVVRHAELTLELLHPSQLHSKAR